MMVFLRKSRKKSKKKHDPRDRTMAYVEREDELNPFPEDDDDSQRAQLSCGHASTPETLTQYLRSQLEQGIYRFTCPALVDGVKRCNKPLSYKEVRRVALLSTEEMQYFEETIGHLRAAKRTETQPCPQCKTYMQRKDLSNLCVQCPICTADQDSVYHFCWQCLKTWSGRAPRKDRCENAGCASRDLQILLSCKSVSLPAVRDATDCPSIRACPDCGLKVEHSQEFCKNVKCPRCHVTFCFLCLKKKSECSKTSTPFQVCATGIAPRQTAIPKWRKK